MASLGKPQLRVPPYSSWFVLHAASMLHVVHTLFSISHLMPCECRSLPAFTSLHQLALDCTVSVDRCQRAASCSGACGSLGECTEGVQRAPADDTSDGVVQLRIVQGVRVPCHKAVRNKS
jgi:hypothetical protein